MPHAYGISPASSRLLHVSAPTMHPTMVVPPMGESIQEGTLAQILKKEGDILQPNDIVAQIETDKVTIDVPYTGSSPAKIVKLNLASGDTVIVGQDLCTLEEGDFQAAAP